MGRVRTSSERGFTLVELMVVVALIAILAAIVVPSFFSDAQKAKADSEVAAIFAELRIREEQYKVERGAYLSTGTGETDPYPATASSTLQPFDTGLPAEWLALRFQSPQPEARCAYVAIAGVAGDPTGAKAQADFGMPATPTTSWYYLLARCDMDGDGGTKDSYYFTSSLDTRIQDLDRGR